MFSAMGSRGLMVGTEELPKKDSDHARESSKKAYLGRGGPDSWNVLFTCE